MQDPADGAEATMVARGGAEDGSTPAGGLEPGHAVADPPRAARPFAGLAMGTRLLPGARGLLVSGGAGLHAAVPSGSRGGAGVGRSVSVAAAGAHAAALRLPSRVVGVDPAGRGGVGFSMVQVHDSLVFDLEALPPLTPEEALAVRDELRRHAKSTSFASITRPTSCAWRTLPCSAPRRPLTAGTSKARATT
jgi:hypothetical protein